MKIQPIDSPVHDEALRLEPVKAVIKSRLKRLLERQFSGVLRNSAAEKIVAGELPRSGKDGSADFDPSSACLAKMVQSFMEENPEKHSAAGKCAHNRYNSFEDSSDAETSAFGSFGNSNYSSSGEMHEILKVF